jgi:hemolysin III
LVIAKLCFFVLADLLYPDSMVDRAREARDKATQRVAAARDAGAERMAAARDAGAERVAAARDNATDAFERVKPKLRGVSHEWAFFLSLGAGAALVLAADDAQARISMAIYAGSLSALLGTSALYHRVNWTRPNVRRWMRRLDHSMIFLLIAGTVTPFLVLVLDSAFADALLVAIWAGALVGIVVELIWIDAPKWVTALIYVCVGWIGALAFPAIVSDAGIGAGALIAFGGVLYTIGAVVYARQRPDPRPATFGYHEIFHLLVILAAAAQFAAVAIYALPAG